MTRRNSPMRSRRARRVPTLGAGLAITVFAACAGDDDAATPITDDPPTSADDAPTSTSATTSAPGTTVAPTDDTALLIDTLRLAAPADCGANSGCAAGLASVYGIDVTAAVGPTDPGQPIVDAVLTGDADVGVLFSDDPALTSNELVALEDDLGMIEAENIVPWAKQALVDDRGEALRSALDTITAALTEEDIRSALAAMRAGDPPDRAAALVAAAGPDDTTVEPGSEAIRIGAENFAIDRLLANVYALGLINQGVSAEVVELDGFRALEVAAMIDDEIDLGIEYAASLLEYLDGFEGRATADSDETLAALQDVLALADYEAFQASDVQSRNVFVMRADVAEANGITKLSDLAAFAPAAEPSPPPGELPPQDDPFAIFGPDDLRIGSIGPDVRELQELLVEVGYDPGPLNGIFEEPTRRAVAHFQVDVGATPDGIVGPVTFDALRNAVEGGHEASTTELSTSGGGDDEIHLSFDDGPSNEWTPQILDLLAQYDAQAVFFSIGNQVEAEADMLRRLVDEGHSVGNHTWDHASLDGMSAATFDDEVGRTQDAIEAATGIRPSCLRPPYGATDGNTDDRAAALGLTIELWNVDPQDWAKPGTDAIVSNVIEHASGGDVVLMHDGGGDREQTVAALGQVLEQLSAEGYRFTAIPGC